MLNGQAGISRQHDLGVLDHFSIGEDSVVGPTRCSSDGNRLAGWRPRTTRKMGKDGKGQFNIYDPDGMRVELMNFHATRSPAARRSQPKIRRSRAREAAWPRFRRLK